MIKELKQRLLGDDRTVGALSEFKSLYETADDPEAFHVALAEGDIEEAAKYHPLTADELHDRIQGMMDAGVALAEEYPEIEETDKEEFINA